MAAPFILCLFETAQDDIQQEKRPASSISVTDEQDRDELQLLGFDLHKETTKIEETRVKTHNRSTVLPNCQVFQDAVSVCQRSYSTPNTPEQRNPEGQDAESSLQKSSLEIRLGASEPINNTGPECYNETCESPLTTQNMNTATKLTKARTQKPKRLHKHPKILCSKENGRTPSDQTESLVARFRLE